MATVRTGAALVEQISNLVVPPGAVAVWWLGQASLVLKVAGTIAYVDPYLTFDDRRLMPPAFPAEAVVNAHVVLLTHDHSDHIDPTALPALSLASPQARFVVPRPIVARVTALVGDPTRVIPAVAAERLGVGLLDLVPVPAKHEEFDQDRELGFPYLGYLLRADGITVYIAGDTLPYEGLIETLAPFDVNLAFLPIDGRDFFRTRRGTIGNMDYREAAELASALNVDTVVPVHYGMFAANTVPPGHFVSYLAEHHPHMQAHVLGYSAPFIFQPPHAPDRGGTAA